MTRYQIFATNPDGGLISVGDPYESMIEAELHAERLRDTLTKVPNAEKVVLTVEAVAS